MQSPLNVPLIQNDDSQKSHTSAPCDLIDTPHNLSHLARCPHSHCLFAEDTETDIWTCSVCGNHSCSPDDSLDCVASCRMCDYNLCKPCFESVCHEQGVSTELLCSCPWLVRPRKPEALSRRGSFMVQKSGRLVKNWEQQRSGSSVPDPDPFSFPFCEGPTWDAFLWLPKSMVPEDLEGPLRRWIPQWQEQTAQYNCHLALGANVTGPAIQKARRANFILWGFYVVNPIIIWYTSRCEVGSVMAVQAVWTPAVFVPVLAITIHLEQECLKYVLAAPYLIMIRRIKVMGIFSTSYRTWRIFALAMSISAHVDVFMTGTVIATAVKASWQCKESNAEETWAIVLQRSVSLRMLEGITLSNLVILSWLAVLCQAFVSFAYAQPLQSDSSIDYTVRERNPVCFKTLFRKKSSFYDALQYFAESSRMHSVVCNDFAYDTNIVMREIRRIHAVVSNHEDHHGENAPVPADMQNFLGTCITWAVFRCCTALRKKVVFFFLLFIMEKMFQLHLKITYMGIQKHLDTDDKHSTDVLALSTAVSMILSLLSAVMFVKKSLTTYNIYRLFWVTITKNKIPVQDEYYVRYVNGHIHLGNQLNTLRRLVACVFACTVLGVWLLAWAAAKLMMIRICEGGLWNISPPWNLRAGCVTFDD